MADSVHYLCRDINGEVHIVHRSDIVRRTSVYALLYDAKGVLLVRDSARIEEQWDLPGGGVEPGEDLIDALTREVREETGLHITGQPIELCQFIEYFFDVESGTGWESTRHYFRAAATGTLEPDGNDDDVVAARYIPPPLPAHDLTPVARKIIALAAIDEGPSR
ncbi:NUDIX hydrolase [Nocardia arthritidis]|uniref:NUDIX domain-containing protein n=1 Tax=Nocardia arthritidis TaxID=228602 RepID=A0A6G9YPH6_9NOCA|nr:NUDIX hydrolase [Nocardia arthritidis]QIS15030.1 NUDIX domain-containing protein [Nocardia arthritidis]